MLNVAERLITLILDFLLGFDLQTCLSLYSMLAAMHFNVNCAQTAIGLKIDA